MLNPIRLFSVIFLCFALGSLLIGFGWVPELALPNQQSPDSRVHLSGIQKQFAEKPPNQVISSSALVQPLSSSVLLTETFEGDFPSAGWSLEDYSSGGNYYFGKRNCYPHGGTYAGWSVGGGSNGVMLDCGEDYPEDIDTWAIYGPFSLSSAATSRLSFFLYGDTEFESDCSYDGLYIGASTDGYNFYGDVYCGDWKNGSETNNYTRVDFNLNAWTGQSEVYIGFNFYSDNSISGKGFHIDDIQITMDTELHTPQPTTPPSQTGTPPSSSAGLFLPVVLRDYPPEPTPTPIPTTTASPAPPTPTSGLQNLVSNGGFESGTSPWFTWGGSRLSVYCRSGNYCMMICSEIASLSQCSPGFYQYITIPNDVVSLNLKFYWRGNVYRDISTNQMYAKIYDSSTTYFTTSRLHYDGNVGYRMYSFILDSATVANLRGKSVKLGFFDDKFFMAQIYYIVDDVELIATR